MVCLSSYPPRAMTLLRRGVACCRPIAHRLVRGLRRDAGRSAGGHRPRGPAPPARELRPRPRARGRDCPSQGSRPRRRDPRLRPLARDRARHRGTVQSALVQARARAVHSIAPSSGRERIRRSLRGDPQRGGLRNEPASQGPPRAQPAARRSRRHRGGRQQDDDGARAQLLADHQRELPERRGLPADEGRRRTPRPRRRPARFGQPGPPSERYRVGSRPVRRASSASRRTTSPSPARPRLRRASALLGRSANAASLRFSLSRRAARATTTLARSRRSSSRSIAPSTPSWT